MSLHPAATPRENDGSRSLRQVSAKLVEGELKVSAKLVVNEQKGCLVKLVNNELMDCLTKLLGKSMLGEVARKC